MILTIDIGNTNITIVLYGDEGANLHEFRAITKKERTGDELGLILNNFTQYNCISNKDIAGVIICSVVPSQNDAIVEACEKYLSKTPYFVSSEENSELKIPLKIKIDVPSCLGADRIATSVGAIERYGKELLNFVFGTATTCEIIGSDSDYLGGIIAPGINTSIQSLHNAASLLPLYKFQKPMKISATSTNEALYAGIFYSTLGMVEKVAAETKKELGQYKFKVIATGGLSPLLKGYTKAIDVYDSDLTTFGLYKIYMYNFGKKI